ncbi:MAG: flagellar regulator YcgR PilZN domain-containing protein [Thiobacillus sp.]
MTQTAHVSLQPDNVLTRYRIENRGEILSLLRNLRTRKCLINVAPGGSVEYSSVTTLLQLADGGRARSFIIDCAARDITNQRLCSSPLHFSASLDGIRINFTTPAASACEFESLPALRVSLPEQLFRLQRRDYFRIPLPITHPVLCRIPRRDCTPAEIVTTAVIDLGCGGIALSDDNLAFTPEIGTLLPDCQLRLPDDDHPLSVMLEVRNLAQFTLRNGALRQRIGCRFVGLPQAAAARLQRYVMQIEQARRNR